MACSGSAGAAAHAGRVVGAREGTGGPAPAGGGWSTDFYAGFPAGQSYFRFPAVLIAILDVFLPYNIAFKLVTALGPVALPVGAYVFGRGIRTPRPASPLFAVAATAFMFFKDGGDATMTFDFHIMGGTLASTFAGEFSFMIALALSLFFL